jgi:hypothetical protein
MILSDFTCPEHGRFEALAESDAESAPCPFVTEEGGRWDEGRGEDQDRICEEPSPWTPTPIRCRVRIGEVERGGVDKPASPMFLDTRELGEGMPMEEWRAKRDKVYEERRHKEAKDFIR